MFYDPSFSRTPKIDYILKFILMCFVKRRSCLPNLMYSNICGSNSVESNNFKCRFSRQAILVHVEVFIQQNIFRIKESDIVLDSLQMMSEQTLYSVPFREEICRGVISQPEVEVRNSSVVSGDSDKFMWSAQPRFGCALVYHK